MQGTLVGDVARAATEHLLEELAVRHPITPLVRDDAPASPMMSTECLSVRYGRKEALRNVTIDILERRISAFIGPSGCGKSTALRCFNRMNDEVPGFRMSGRVVLDGIDVNDRAVNVNALRKNVGMVFQHPNPFPMSIYDNIALAVQEHDGRIGQDGLDEVVERSLRQANLWNEVKGNLRDSAFSLSGGQQQRLCIARALAVRPRVLMLDEPCASLDPISTARIEELLLELSADYTIVIVTHNLQQAQRISDQVAFFLIGELIEQGETRAMFDSPAHRETGDYLRGAYG